ncbi:glycosyltransferase family 2 protein [Halocatena halophila]|uniref:glycosyltransferase family 2 protein n=1 Tax=Halocatena halophila TaxID=2814576 RepID=UPI002ED4560F
MTVYQDHTVGVVVTAYNEEPFIGDVIESVPEFVDRVYVVDDCSSDGTWEAITEHVTPATRPERAPIPDGGQHGDGRVVAIRHTTNQGVGGAIKSGFERALEDNLDVVAVMDGDGQMDPGQLERLLDPIVEGPAHYAKGNRLSQVEHVDAMSPFRLFGNILLTALTRIVSGYWRMRDPQNGYNAIDTELLHRIEFDRLHDRYGFRNDLLIHLGAHGATVADVSMPAVYGDERSHIRLTTFVPALSWLLARRFFWRLQADQNQPSVGSPSAALVLSLLTSLSMVVRLRRRDRTPRWLTSLITTLSCLLMMSTVVEDRYANDETITIGNHE